VSDLKKEKEENKIAEIEDIPLDWKTKKLKELVTIVKGKKPSKIFEQPFYNSKPYILMDFKNKYYTNDARCVECSKDDIIILWDGSQAGQVLTGFEGYIGSTMALLKFKIEQDYYKKYFYYYLSKNEYYIQNLTAGTGIPHVQKDVIENLFIPTPPIPEQRKIAEILETIDNAIEKTDAIIEKYKRIKQGLMQVLLTKGIDENGRIRDEKTHKFKDSPLGRIPEEWEVVRLGEAGRIVSGATPDTSKPQFWNGDIVWVTPDDLSKQKKYIYTSQRKISKDGLKSCATKIIPSDSIVLSSRAPIGYLAIVKTNYSTNQGCKSIILNKNYYDEDFFYYCLHRYINKMISLASGTTFNEISKSQLAKLEVTVPCLLSEQHRIASILSQIDEVIEKEQVYKEKLARVKKGLMEDLLIGKVRVNHLIEEENKNEQQA